MAAIDDIMKDFTNLAELKDSQLTKRNVVSLKAIVEKAIISEEELTLHKNIYLKIFLPPNEHLKNLVVDEKLYT